LAPAAVGGTDMAGATHGTNARASTYWCFLAGVFLVVSIVSALGEWVFHWWN
jgi:hypothetical protein